MKNFFPLNNDNILEDSSDFVEIVIFMLNY